MTKHGTTLTELNRTLKRILEKIGSPSLVITKTRSVSVDLNSTNLRLNSVITELQAANVDLAALEVLATAGNVDLAALEVLGTAANVDLAAIEVLLTTLNTLTTTIDGVLDSMNSKLDTIDSIDYFLSGDTTDGGDLLNELQSIDQNWNLLSVNQLNLAAILVAVLNNATSGRQDRLVQGSFEFSLHLWIRYTTTGNGTFQTTITIPSGQKLYNWWIHMAPTIGGARNIQVLIQTPNSRNWMIAFNLAAMTSGAKYHAPHPFGETVASGEMDGRSHGLPLPAGTKIIFFSSSTWTTTTPDKIEIAMGGDLRTNSIPTTVVGGTGTFSETPKDIEAIT